MCEPDLSFAHELLVVRALVARARIGKPQTGPGKGNRPQSAQRTQNILRRATPDFVFFARLWLTRFLVSQAQVRRAQLTGHFGFGQWFEHGALNFFEDLWADVAGSNFA